LRKRWRCVGATGGGAVQVRHHARGPLLFRVDPDEKVGEEDPGARARRIRETTDRDLASLL